MKRKILIAMGALAALVVSAVVAFAVTGGPLADLRPDTITASPQPEREARGRALLEGAWQAAGGARTLARPAARFQFRDHWQGIGTLFNPWPSDDQRVDFTIHTHTFDSRATLLNGPEAGVTWGIDGFQGWKEHQGVRTASDDGNLRFMLPTVHYFMEMPQRLTEAPIVRWVETKDIGGRSYDVVYATWESVEAHEGADQYLIFIDTETHRIAKTKYTVREIARFATGTCHLDDQREVDGVWVSHVMSITPEPEDDPDAYLHRMTVSDFAWLDERGPGSS